MSLISLPGIASQWTSAGGGDTSGTLVPISDVSVTPTGTPSTNVYAVLDDDPDSPDGNWYTRSGATLTDATFGMSAPSGTPGGTDAQEVRVLLRKVNSSGTPSADGRDPVFSIEIDGTAVITDDTIGDVSSVVKSASFDDSVSSDWSTLEVRVNQTTNGGGPAGDRRYIEIGAIEVNWSAT